MSRLLTATLLAICLSVTPALAQAPKAPEDVVSEIYRFYDGAAAIGVWPTDPAVLPLFSERLEELLHIDEERAQSSGIGLLDFDPFVDGHDFVLDSLAIRTTANSGDAALVEVRFLNFDEHTRIVYSLVREDEGWAIDEISAPDSAYPWQLSRILQGD